MKCAWLPLALLLGACGSAPKQPSEPAPKPAPKITQFYASPATIPPGDRSLLCYGVEGATTLTLTPAVEEIKPALSRCIEVRPKTTTEYVLTADGAGGQTQSRTVITVDPKAPRSQAAVATPVPPKSLIRFLVASEQSVTSGQQFTVCYGLAAPATVTLDPPLAPATPGDRSCFNTSLNKTTTITLSAKGQDGRTDQEKLTVTVR
jgi:hypothetical protein